MVAKARWWCAYVKRVLLKPYRPDSWFHLNSRIKTVCPPSLKERWIPDADYIVACPVESASFVNSYSPAKGKKFYFIQHFEGWAMAASEVEKTWKMPLEKIVISRWLQRLAERMGEEAIYVPNAFDFSRFGIDTPFDQRPLHSILFIAHILEIKGTRFVAEAAERLKRRFPDLVVEAFGMYDPPPGFPDFIRYYRNPSQMHIRALYNRSRIFIAASLTEGWGLPAGEAMLCGCAVVATDIDGHREFMKDRENGLLCLPGSAASIVEKVEWVFDNPSEAEKIAHAAPGSLRRFNWDASVSLFERALLG